MVEDRIRNIEARVQGSNDLPEATRAELLALIGQLRAELAGVQLPQPDPAGAPAHTETAGDSAGSLAEAMTTIETTHPQLAEIANRIAIALSNMGI